MLSPRLSPHYLQISAEALLPEESFFGSLMKLNTLTLYDIVVVISLTTIASLLVSVFSSYRSPNPDVK